MRGEGFRRGVSQYATYVVVGVGVTIATVLLRSLLGLVIHDDTRSGYQLTIVLAYVVGIAMSLYAHKAITFRWQDRLTPAMVGRFVAVHGLGMLGNLVGSAWLNDTLQSLGMPDAYAKDLAFACVAFLVSLVSFVLKKLFVFVLR